MPPTRRSNARYCTLRCCQLRYVRKNPEQRREQISAINRKRYAEDPLWRLEVLRKTRHNRNLSTYGYDPGDNPLAYTKDRFRAARALGYRSGLEVAIANDLKARGVAFEYEPFWIPYVPKARIKKYKPDLCLPNGIIIEGKGRFETHDRQKHLAVKESNPDLDVRFVFSNARSRISKTSSTTYGMWCLAKGFQYADKTIPLAWLEEPPNHKSLKAIEALR